MGCAFQTAIKFHKPELIFILGKSILLIKKIYIYIYLSILYIKIFFYLFL